MTLSTKHVDVSVVIPAYNAALSIRRALMSVRNQTVTPREVIVVDDGSADDTVSIVEACTDELTGVSLQVARQPNLGAGAARNRALALAQSKYIAFLDADDEWLPEKLERSLDHLIVRQLDLVAHNGWVIDNKGLATELDIACRFRAAASDPMHGLYRRGFISTSSVVTRRAMLLDAGAFDEGLRTGQDFDLWLRMLCCPDARFEVFDDKLTRYHVYATGITGNTDRRLDNTLRIALRHAATLHRHSGRYVASLWFRVTALHVEACTAYWRSARRLKLIQTAGMLPFRLAWLTLHAIRLVARER